MDEEKMIEEFKSITIAQWIEENYKKVTRIED